MTTESPTPTLPAAHTVIGQIYTTEEVAKMLRVSQRTVQDWIRSGLLTAVRYGRLLRVREADLQQFGEVVSPRPDPGRAHHTPA
jgi:excisionase family DNA binding protein